MRVYKHSKYDYATIVEIQKAELKKIDMVLCKQPRETLKSFYDRQETKPDFIINGGLFNMSDGTTCFNLIDENKTIAALNYYTLGMGVVDEAKLIYGDVKGRTDWRDFVSGYPPLVVDGKACKITYATELDYKARRSILGYNNSFIFLIAVELPGMTFEEAQFLALTVGCKYAINIDGGGSTKILQNGKSITSSLYNRAVDNVIAVYLKNKEESTPVVQKTIYRVQLGAFGSKANAENLLAKIKVLPDTIGAGYSSAYIRLVNGLYKVQVGAFSVKTNADKVLLDLKDKGYSAFITT